jgi:hypothetical protein
LGAKRRSIRERRHFWRSAPSILLIVSSAADILIASLLAIGGIAMTALPAALVAETLAAAVGFAFVLDMVKVPYLPVWGSPSFASGGSRAQCAKSLQKPPPREFALPTQRWSLTRDVDATRIACARFRS